MRILPCRQLGTHAVYVGSKDWIDGRCSADAIIEKAENTDAVQKVNGTTVYAVKIGTEAKWYTRKQLEAACKPAR